MRSSTGNTMTNRPTATFYYVVRGWRDNHGKDRVTQVDLRTNRRDAIALFRKVEKWDNKDFIRLYAVDGRTTHANPDFSARLLKTR